MHANRSLGPYTGLSDSPQVPQSQFPYRASGTPPLELVEVECNDRKHHVASRLKAIKTWKRKMILSTVSACLCLCRVHVASDKSARLIVTAVLLVVRIVVIFVGVVVAIFVAIAIAINVIIDTTALATVIVRFVARDKTSLSYKMLMGT